MKKVLFMSSVLLTSLVVAQENRENESDTTRFKIGPVQVILVKDKDTTFQDYGENTLDTIDASPREPRRNSEAYWSGVDFGFNVLTNGSASTDLAGYEFLENDPARSFTINLNFAEKKVNIIREYFGLTTGLGFSFVQFALSGDVLLNETADSLLGAVSPVNFSKNKLRATYFQIPLLLEFNTNKENDKGVSFATGVIGGVRIASQVKRVGESNGERTKEKIKGLYALNTFKLDATARIGFDKFGAFANYSLLPLFTTDKVMNIQPFTFGLTMNL